MSAEFDLREVNVLVGEINDHVNSARDANTNQLTERFAWELGCAAGAASRLHKMLVEIAQREFYSDDE